MARTIAIGDIHGCSAALRALVGAIAPTPDDLLITLGDYVDRGPDSRGVLEFLIKLEEETRLEPLVGNHELMLLGALQSQEVREHWMLCGGRETAESYGGIENFPAEHREFLESCRASYETREHLFVHANYEPRLPLARQPEELLFWTHLHVATPGPHASGKRVIVGHTPQSDGEPLDLGHVVCIDTHCYASGWLTALDVERGTLWQADKSGQLRAR